MAKDISYDDKALFAQIAEGDEQAFRELYIVYARILSPFLNKLTGHSGAAEDILQNTFLSVWMNRDKLTDVENPKAWIFRIAANGASTWLTKNKLQRRKEHASVSGSDQGQDFTSQIIDYNEAMKLVERAVAELPSQRRKIYTMHREEGLKYGEIANQLNISASTVRTAISLSLEHIRKKLIEAGLFALINFFLSAVDTLI